MAYIGQQPFQEFTSIPTKDSFTGDGSTTTFDLANDVVRGAENALEVFVDNVRQEPGSGKAFTLGIDGSNNYRRITFTAAPANGAAIYVLNDKTNLTSIAPIQTDFNGAELVLDADGDTTLHADTDDEIDVRIGGNDVIMLKQSSGDGIITIPTDAKDLQFTQFDGYKVLEINDGGFVGVGGNSNAAGEIRIFEDSDNGSNYSGFKAAASTTSSVAYTLPAADGSSGTHLTTNGSGVLSWAASLSLANDSNNRVVTGTGSGLNGEANLTFDGSTLAVTGAITGSSDLTLQNDLILDSDAAVLSFGADNEVTLTHVHNTGILLNSTNVIQFNDASQNIGAPSATVLDINATDEIELNATLVDVNANLDVSGTYTGAGLMTTGGNIVIPDAGNIGSASDTDAIAIASNGITTFSQAPVLSGASISAGTTPLTALDIDGGTDIGEAIVDADLFIIDNGAGGTNRKTTAARIKTYIGSFDPDGAQTFNDSGAAVDFRVEGDTDTHLLMVDGSSDKVGIGEDVPEGKLHIFTGDASVGPNSDADELVVEGSGETGISILSGASNSGTINFGDSGDDNVGSIFYDHSSNYLAFKTGGAEGMRVQSNGKLYINHTEDISTGTTHQLQVAKNNTAASMVVHAGLNTDGAGNYTLSKSRNATPGSSTIVQNNDVLGTFRWIAADGNDLNSIAGTIDCRIDGTPGQDDVPTRMSFGVAPDGANSPTERFRISQNGDLTATDTGIGSLSDERMKENIADFTYALSTFKNLRPRQFTWKNPTQHSGTGTKRGFIAQEIGAVDSIFSYDYDLNKEDLDYSLIYNDDGSLKDESAGKAKAARLHSKDAMYVSVIKQLITKIETLETEMTAIKARVTTLEG